MLKSLKLCHRSFLLSATLSVLASPTSYAQNIAGAWQGTIQTHGYSSRIVLKASRSDSGDLRVDIYWIDNGANRIPVNNITFDGSTLKFPMTGYSGDYAGKMSADGNTIAGAWKQDNGPSIPLTFTRATPETAWTIPATKKSSLPAMAADAHPALEVATIKPSAPVDDSHNFRLSLRRGVISPPRIPILSISSGTPTYFSLDRYWTPRHGLT